MKIQKNSEKILIWMHRKNKTIQEIAGILGISRQLVSKKINENTFTENEIRTIERIMDVIFSDSAER